MKNLWSVTLDFGGGKLERIGVVASSYSEAIEKAQKARPASVDVHGVNKGEAIDVD